MTFSREEANASIISFIQAWTAQICDAPEQVSIQQVAAGNELVVIVSTENDFDRSKLFGKDKANFEAMKLLCISLAINMHMRVDFKLVSAPRPSAPIQGVRHTPLPPEAAADALEDFLNEFLNRLLDNPAAVVIKDILIGSDMTMVVHCPDAQDRSKLFGKDKNNYRALNTLLTSIASRHRLDLTLRFLSQRETYGYNSAETNSGEASTTVFTQTDNG
jgi:predicted RNA-binding protein YlqC (UPF0109 family)